MLIRAGITVLFVFMISLTYWAQKKLSTKIEHLPTTQISRTGSPDRMSIQSTSVSTNDLISLQEQKPTEIVTGYPFNWNPSVFLFAFSLLLYAGYVGMGVIAHDFNYEIYFNYFRFIIFIDVFMFTFSRMMFRFALICGLTLWLLYLSVDAVLADPVDLLLRNFIVIAVLVFQIAEGYLLERQLRRNFLLETKINNERTRNLDERDRSEELLKNILPPSVVEQMKGGDSLKLQKYSEVSVIHIDMVGFTSISSHMNPVEVITMLNLLFSFVDRIADKFGIEKIKTGKLINELNK